MKLKKMTFTLALLSLCFVIVACAGKETPSDSDKTTATTVSEPTENKNVCLLSYVSKGNNVTVPDSVSCRVGSLVTLAKAPERKFYIFKGWSDGENCYEAGQSIVISRKTELEAVWELDRTAAISSEYMTFSNGDNGECTLTGFKESGFVGVYLEVPESDGKGNRVTAIAEAAFENNTALAGVRLHSGIESIGKRAFYNCTSLEWVEFPEGLRIIDEYAFYYCISLQKLALPATLEIIAPYAFRSCSGLLRLSFENGIKSVGENAFRGCSRLSVIDCPESLERLGDYSFAGCSALRNVNYKASQDKWKKIEFGKGNESFVNGATFAF